ncbi:MAG: MoxR family ATPase [Mariniblastus sp.]|nr:MoxR family ATPase [Mariniblastus sp.]|tara:strand:+ start:1483 stop:2553 length:1071 start_codon:yes stop_codon:yes gene_type:complete
MNDRVSGGQAELSGDEIKALEKLSESYRAVREQLGKVIVGQNEVIEQLMIAIFAQGHCLLEGVPGLAKTLMVSTLADTLNLDFNRIQFTPDLMPSDIVGTEVIQEDKASGKREFKFLKGPVFANIVLADEINRTPPKTQAALLEAMQERQVTIGGERNKLPAPFFVLATQNPIEQEGTYTLPEAQQDRFMFKIFVTYPSYDEEYQIAATTTADNNPTVEQVLTGEDILRLQQLVRRVPVAPHLIHFALRIVRATRVLEDECPEFVKEAISWGAGPRGVQNLLLGAKARAVLEGRSYATTEDLRAVAKPVLRHRVITNFNADSTGVTSDDIIDRLLTEIPERSEGDQISPELVKAFS